MKSFVTIFGAATGAYASCCTFELTASGGQSGSVGQLSDGQIRIGGGLPSSSFSICNATITDANGYGCLLTPEVEQFQCDLNKSPQSGFSIASSGSFEYSGSSVFYACPASDSEWNIYTTPVVGQAKCVEISLTASGCGAQATCSSTPASTVTQTVTEAVTVTEASTVTVTECASVSVPPVTYPAISTTTPIETYSYPESTPIVTYPITTPESTPIVTYSTSTPVTESTPPVETYSVTSTYVTLPTETLPTYTASSTVIVSPPYSESTTCTESTIIPTYPPTTYTTTSVPLSTYTPPISTGPTTLCTSTLTTSSAHWSNYTTTATPTTSTGTASTCVSTALTGTYTAGNYQYPHLIVPISSNSPDTSYGTQYFGTISSNVSTIFNFDIPTSYSGHTCNLIFLLPLQSELETSSYEFSGNGKVEFEALSGVATTSTTYKTAPAVSSDLGDFTLTEGSSTLISSFACPAGETVAYEAKAVADTYLYFFQDYNPSPLGLYITVC